jgi:hypothetical protein
MPGPEWRHRAGFFLGDGAGVGKGRQAAGLIYEHHRCGGRRVLWISVSNDLKAGSYRLTPGRPPVDRPWFQRLEL